MKYPEYATYDVFLSLTLYVNPFHELNTEYQYMLCIKTKQNKIIRD